MRIDNVAKSRQPLILAKEKNLLQAGRRRRGGVGQIGGGAGGVQGALQGARSASCWNKRNSSASSEPNYFCPDDISRFLVNW